SNYLYVGPPAVSGESAGDGFSMGEPMRRMTEDWVEVVGVGDDEKAEIIAGMLNSEGIPAEVEGPALTPFPEELGAFGLHRVMVPTERADEARALIAERERGEGSATEEIGSE